MIYLKLELKEVKNKVIKAKIDVIFTLVYIGYNYYECPICHWFKFVLK
jgi:hypothetical protein